MKKVSKFAMVVSKVLEVLHWIAAAAMLVLFLLAVFGWKPLGMENLGIINEAGGALTFSLGYKIEMLDAGNKAAVMLSILEAFFELGLSAMIFRNVYLILKTTMGKTWFSKGQTPFQKDNIRMVREIGIFYISATVIGLIMSIVSRIALGPEMEEISVDMTPLVTGLIILCLSETFAYGAQLQKDVDGLV